jgi:acetoin utilization protein AcuB
MKTIPAIQKYMTAMPHTIGNEQNLKKAHEMMREFKIRHLPVLKAGKLVGIITDRDLALVEALRDVDPNTVLVEEACTPEPYIVAPDAKLSDVCEEMARHKYGSVLIVDNHKLVGIFTWVDALNAFGELLETRLKN